MRARDVALWSLAYWFVTFFGIGLVGFWLHCGAPAEPEGRAACWALDDRVKRLGWSIAAVIYLAGLAGILLRRCTRTRPGLQKT